MLVRVVLNCSFCLMPPDPQPCRYERAGETTDRTVTSAQLLAGQRQVIIEHGGERYRLLLTRTNKLILVK
jgi:hemin uptake protein HemP